MTNATQILGAIPYPCLMVNTDGRIVAANDDTRSILGPDIVTKHYITVLRQPGLLDCIEACLTQKEPGRTKFLGRSLAFDQVFQASIRPVVMDAGNAALVTFEDTTAADEISKFRRDFVANVSHELRTPLTAISGMIETLQGPAANDNAARVRFLELMNTEAHRMGRLIDDLLALSRVQAEHRIPPRQQVNVNDVVQTVVERYAKQARDAGHTLTPDVPATDQVIQGDEPQLIQVLSNLVENAIKYLPQQTRGQVTISVGCLHDIPELRRQGVRIDVTDNGTGIDPIHIPRLTERFYRIDTHRSRDVGGTGLGLAIVKHIVNRHRGRLRISSDLGQGSTFTVLLPRDTKPQIG